MHACAYTHTGRSPSPSLRAQGPILLRKSPLSSQLSSGRGEELARGRALVNRMRVPRMRKQCENVQRAERRGWHLQLMTSSLA